MIRNRPVAQFRHDAVEEFRDDRQRSAGREHTLAIAQFGATREEPLHLSFANRLRLAYERADDGDRGASLIPARESLRVFGYDLLDQRNRIAPLLERDVDDVLEAVDVGEKNVRNPRDFRIRVAWYRDVDDKE